MRGVGSACYRDSALRRLIQISRNTSPAANDTARQNTIASNTIKAPQGSGCTGSGRASSQSNSASPKRFSISHLRFFISEFNLEAQHIASLQELRKKLGIDITTRNHNPNALRIDW